MVENICIFALSGKGLGNPDSIDTLCYISIEIGLLITLDLPGISLLRLNKNYHKYKYWQTAKTNYCQPYIYSQHKYKNKNQVAQISYGIDNTIAEKVA